MRQYFESALGEEAFKAAIRELDDVLHIRWNFRKNKFIIRERVAIPRIYFVVARVRGVCRRENGKILIELSRASSIGVRDCLLFIVLSFCVLMCAGINMGVDLPTILLTLGAELCFALAVSNVFSICCREGRDRYSEIIDTLTRSLQLTRRD